MEPTLTAAHVAIQSIGFGFDTTEELSLEYLKRRNHSEIGSNPYRNSRLVEIKEDEGRDVLLPGGQLVHNVSQSIRCDEGEHRRLQSGVLSFAQMSQQFNQELSLDGKIPSRLFNDMFEFSGKWVKDASSTKTLAFDGVFISLYTVALEKSQMVLCDHVKKAVPSSWEPALLARFIKKFGTHIIVGVKMGGKDVIYMKQHHESFLEPADVQKKLKSMADKRFLESHGQYAKDSEDISQNDKDLVSICKRGGGNDDRNLKHNEWLNTVKLEPDVITMSLVPMISLLNGVLGSAYLSHAISLYLRYKPPLEELHMFLEFSQRRAWAPNLDDLHSVAQSTASIQFSYFGPKLYVNTNPVDVGKNPVAGIRLYLNRLPKTHLEIHIQQFDDPPKFFQLEDSVTGIFNSNSVDHRYFEKVQGKYFDKVCTAPVESGDEFSIVTGAQLQVGDHGSKKVLFLHLHFSKLLNFSTNKSPE
ncbi:hypothetical protein LXL04_016960 [Taraxacum kok-saghyz]